MAEQYREYTDPITGDIYRDGVRDGKYVIDKVLTAAGFSGVEDTDWENISEIE
jgi:hypothetical protein